MTIVSGPILIAESGSGYGGTAVYLASLLGCLGRDRFQVEIASYNNGPVIAGIERAGWPVTYPANWVYSSPAALIFQAPAIARQLNKRGIRLVHLNNEILSHLPLLIAAKLAGCRVLCHLHGWRPFTRIERAALGLVDQFIAISEAGARYFSAQCGRVVLAVPNGITVNGQLENFSQKRRSTREKLGVTADQKIAAIFGRLVPWKGHEVYLTALAKVRKSNPNVTGLIVGHDPSPQGKYLSHLKKMAEALGLGDKVIFLPWQEDVWQLYAASDCVVHASTQPEPFGLVILEAMLAARPVVATRGGGVSEIMLDQVTGQLVEPGDVDEMAAAILEVLTENLGTNYARTAGERVRTEYDMKRNSERIAALYQRMLS